MNELVHHPLAFFLVKLSVGSLLLLGAALLIARLCRKGTPATRCQSLQWGLIAVLLLPFAFLLPGQSADRATRMLQETGIFSTGPDESRTIPIVSDRTNAVAISTESSSSAASDVAPKQRGEVSRSRSELGKETAESEEPVSAESRSVPWAVATLNLTVCVWLFVAALRLVGIMLSVIRASRLAGTGECALAESSIACPARQLKIDIDRVNIRFAETSVPLTTGCWRHCILLPDSARRWDESRIWMVLAHEMAHIRRADVAMSVLCQVALALVWFNPLAWVVFRQAEREREIACDDQVLLRGGCAADYAECLLSVSRYFSPHASLAAVSIAEPPLLSRLRSILAPNARRGSGSRRSKVGIAGAMTALVLACGLLHPSAPAGPVAQEDDEGEGTRTDALGDPLEKHVLHRFGTRRFQHPAGVLEMCISSDGESIVTYGRRLVIGWDAQSGKQLWSVERGPRASREPRFGTGYGLRVMAKATGTGELVSLRTQENIPIWNPRTGEVTELELPEADPEAKAIDVSPDGKLIALGGPSKLEVYSRDGKWLFAINNDPKEDIREVVGEQGGDRLAFPGEFSYPRFAPNGKLLALVNSEKPTTIQIFDASTGAAIREIATTGRVVRYTFSPDSNSIVATERDVTVRLYNVADGQQVWETKFKPADGAESYTSAIDFHPDGSQIAIGAVLGPDRSVRLLDAKTGKETSNLGYPGWRPWTLHYSSDGTVLLGSGWDGTVHRWESASGKLLALPGGLRASTVCSIAGKGRLLAFEDSDSQIHLADQRSGKTIRKLSVEGVDWSSIQFSPDASLLAASGVDKKQIHLVIWNVEDGTQAHHWSWDTGRDPHSVVYSLSFSGNQIAANVFRQSAAYVWDLTTGKQVTKVQHRMVFGSSLTDGVLTTVGWDRRMATWDSITGKELDSLTTGAVGPGGRIEMGGDTRMYSVRVSADRSLTATNDMTRSIRLYDRDWNEVVTIGKAGGSQRAFALSRNALWVSYADTQLNVYDVATGDAVFQATAHQQGIDTIEFGPKDRTILTGGDDGVCNLWEFPSPSSKLDDDQAFQKLVGENGKFAFAVFQHLDDEPDRASRLLETRLARFAEQDVAEADVRKQLIAIGSGRKTLVEQAKQRLFELGPGVVPILRSELAAGELGDEKKSAIIQLAFKIQRRYRRASMLLAQLDSDQADAALDRMVRQSKSTHAAGFFEEAAEYRRSLK